MADPLTISVFGKPLFSIGRSKTSPSNRAHYKGAEQSRLTADWMTAEGPADKFIKQDLSKLRQRAADLERNNDYIRRFLREVEINVIGDGGIRYAPKIPKKDARAVNGFSNDLDPRACEMVAKAWEEFSKKENFTASRRFSRTRFEQLLVRSVARDGGAFVRSIRGIEKRPFRFAIQSFRATHHDHSLEDPDRGISAGTELNEWDEPMAWHFFKRDKNPYSRGYQREHFRLPASEGRHIFIADSMEQTLGVPWYASAMFRLRQLEAYEEAEVIAARLQAQKIGFFELAEGAQYTGDTSDAPLMPSAPGEWQELPAGVTANLINPTHPNGNYPDFRKAMLRGITAGLSTSYNVISNDLEGVNFSSIRAGTLSEREAWMLVQQWLIDDFEGPIFSDWLEMAILSNQLPLSVDDHARLCVAEFSGRRWSWVDPLKDIKAAGEEIALGINSRQRVARDRGRNFDELTKENEADTDQMVEAQLVLPLEPAENDQPEPTEQA